MAAQRIVSLVPSLTELLADLGLDDEVVGLTRFCVHPADWKARKTIVGGTKNVDPERVRPLAPDVVLASKEENVREQVEAIGTFAPVHLTDIATVDGALDEIRRIGVLVGRAPEAEKWAADIASAFSSLAPEAEPARGHAPPPSTRALYLIWREPWMTVGGDTYISDVMARGGFANVCADQTRYPVLTPEAITALAPDVVMLSSEPYPFAQKHIAELQPLAPEAEIVLVDGEAFSWYGSRMRTAPDALHALRQSLA
ncbi:helical backbone metal receptor [Rubricoccus marinus]|uniref:Cobalamin-binding protein n=1 Tax=Rubricoccus marinus TaxID=716817 RepID=A0A259TWA8_9BACT|nr:helical backbone metal receptor [Rubricoccus marinus]OZC01838.1 cobalamin-binding protein [Rubricoccus marinus]